MSNVDHELNDRIEIRDGLDAARELAKCEFALEAIREEALNQIVTSDPKDQAFRERMIVTCQIMDAVKKALYDTVNAGQAASAKANMAAQNLLRRTGR